MGNKTVSILDGIPPWVPDGRAFDDLFALDCFGELLALDEADQRYEIIVREQIVLCDHLALADIERLDSALRAYCIDNPCSNDRFAFALFFICFEWYHRQTNDKEERSRRWRRLFKSADDCFSNFALFSYALSVYHRFDGRIDLAMQTAREASELAPRHIGLLNNYAEIVLDVKERQILSLQEERPLGESPAKSIGGGGRCVADGELLAVLDSFRKRSIDQDFATFHINQGRLEACLGDYDNAHKEFDRAVDLAVGQFETKSRSASEAERLHCGSEYVQLMTWVSTSRNTCYQMQNIRAMRDDAARSQKDTQSLIDELSAKNADVERRLNDERINMVEMLAFFAGIISLIVASIQIGDDLSFMSRAFLVLVMLGALLVAFGALSALLEAGRSATASLPSARRRGYAQAMLSGRTVPVIVIGLAVIVLGVVLNFMAPQ